MRHRNSGKKRKMIILSWGLLAVRIQRSMWLITVIMSLCRRTNSNMQCMQLWVFLFVYFLFIFLFILCISRTRIGWWLLCWNSWQRLFRSIIVAYFMDGEAFYPHYVNSMKQLYKSGRLTNEFLQLECNWKKIEYLRV